MPLDLHIFQPAYAFIDGRLGAILGDRVAAMMAEVAGPLRIALVLYIVLYGYAIFRGSIAEPVFDFALRSIKLVFISAIATTPAYADYITQPLFSDLPTALARAAAGSSATTVGEAFDELMNNAGYLGSRGIKEGNLVNIGPWIIGALVLLVGALAAALGFGMVMVAKIGLALLVTIGPIFVALALFEVTRRFFFGWLAQGVNYLLLFALTLVVVQLMLDLVRSQWSSIYSLDTVSGGLVFIVLCLLAGFFFLHMPTLAAGIAGGASAGVADFAQAGSRLASRALHAHQRGQRSPASRQTGSSAQVVSGGAR